MLWSLRLLLLLLLLLFLLLDSSHADDTTETVISGPPLNSTPRVERCVSRGTAPSLSLVCFLKEWTPNARALAAFNRSHVEKLRLKIWKESSRLTAAHLRGFDRLRALAVIGTCRDTFPYRNTGFCEESKGIKAVDNFAFAGAPQLRRLYLVTHPLERLENLDHLTHLTRLHLQSMSQLEHIMQSALDPIRASIEQIQLLDNSVSRLDAWMFKNMTRLKGLHWSGALTVVGTECLADLPQLQAVALRVRTSSVTIGQTGPTLKPLALARLPRLKEFHMHNMDHKDDRMRPEPSPQPPQPVCSIEGSEMHTVHATFVHVDILKLCHGLFSCPSCGANPTGEPQRIHLQRIYGASGKFFALKELFPRIGTLNVSELELIATKVDRLTDELGWMPLLRKLRIHRGVFIQMSHPDNQRVGNIRRLSVNPFKFLRSPELLNSVRIVVNVCDCVTLEMIEWFEALALKRKGRAEDVLLLGCENLKCTCDERSSGSLPLGDSTMPWQDLTTMVHVLRPLCREKKEKDTFGDPELMCHAKCETLEQLNLKTAGAVRTTSWPFLGLCWVLTTAWVLSRVS